MNKQTKVFFKYIIVLAAMSFWHCSNTQSPQLESKAQSPELETKLQPPSLTASTKISLDTLLSIKSTPDQSHHDRNSVDSKSGFRDLKFGLNIDSIDFQRLDLDTIEDGLIQVKVYKEILFDNNCWTNLTLTFYKNKLIQIQMDFSGSSPGLSDKLNAVYGKPSSLEKRSIQEFSDAEIRKFEFDENNRPEVAKNAFKAEKEIEKFMQERSGYSKKEYDYFWHSTKKIWNGNRIYAIHFSKYPPKRARLVNIYPGEGEGGKKMNSLGVTEYLVIGEIMYKSFIEKKLNEKKMKIKKSNDENESREIKKRNTEISKQF